MSLLWSTLAVVPLARTLLRISYTQLFQLNYRTALTLKHTDNSRTVFEKENDNWAAQITNLNSNTKSVLMSTPTAAPPQFQVFGNPENRYNYSRGGGVGGGWGGASRSVVSDKRLIQNALPQWHGFLKELFCIFESQSYANAEKSKRRCLVRRSRISVVNIQRIKTSGLCGRLRAFLLTLFDKCNVS